MNQEPKTYWEKRAVLAEDYCDKIATILGAHLPSSQADITRLDESWSQAIDALNAEFAEKVLDDEN